MTSSSSNNNNGNELLQTKISEYSNFISQTLQPQLQSAVDAREETEAEISEYVQLKAKLQQIQSDAPKSIDTIVDISHSTIYCKAHISNPKIIYVNVGFGFHVEMTIEEAIQFITKRVEYLESCVLKHRVEAAARIAKDVENAIELLEELGDELTTTGEAKRSY